MPEFKNIKDLKEFLIWCKDNSMLHVEIEGAKFTFSENLVAYEKTNTDIDNIQTLDKDASKTSDDDDDEKLLFWST